MKKYKAIVMITYILLAICGFAADYFYDIMPDVTLTKAQVGRVVDTVSYAGTVQAQGVYVFSSEASRVVKVYVEEGQYVQKGDLLVRLDINDTSVDNIRQEVQQGIPFGTAMNESVLSEIFSGVVQEGAYESVCVEGAGIRAPISGYISNIGIQEGEYAGLVTPLFLITDRSKMCVRIQVAEDRISEIMEGQLVSISGSGFSGQTYYGRVEEIADQASQSLLNSDGAKIAVNISLLYPDISVMPGFTATATIRLGTRDDVIKIPLDLIDQDNTGKEYVWIYHDGIVQKEYIDCRYTAYGYAEVNNFNAEQWIVEQASSPLVDGIAVQLAEG